MSRGVGTQVGAHAERDRVAPLAAAIGAIVLVAWCAAIATGLGRLLLGPTAAPVAYFALYLPGVAIGSGLIAYAALRRLAPHVPRWVPRAAPAVVVPDVVAPSVLEGDGAELMARRRMPRVDASETLAIVHLGPASDPAWAAWGLRWEAPGLGSGLVPLPSGARVMLGRDPGGDVVVRLDQVSWQHLELDVQEARVIAFELGSSNGTRTSAGEVIEARTPWPWAPGETLQLASPVALTLTLEPLR